VGTILRCIAALNGTDLGGRTLTINEAKPKAERPRAGHNGEETEALDQAIYALHLRSNYQNLGVT
jgi:hypothetical protein